MFLKSISYMCCMYFVSMSSYFDMVLWNSNMMTKISQYSDIIYYKYHAKYTNCHTKISTLCWHFEKNVSKHVNKLIRLLIFWSLQQFAGFNFRNMLLYHGHLSCFGDILTKYFPSYYYTAIST